MGDSPLISAGEFLRSITYWLNSAISLLITVTIAIAVGLLLVRVIADLIKLNPFGRMAYYARRPTDEVIRRMHQSQFYLPLKRALKFDPSIIMVLIALAILWFVTTSVVSYLFIILSGLSRSLIAFGSGEVFSGIRYLIGATLLAVIFFLISLMTIVFVNWIFGLLGRASYWAMERISPLLRVFDFGGVFAGWSFLILWIALSFAATAVQAIFF